MKFESIQNPHGIIMLIFLNLSFVHYADFSSNVVIKSDTGNSLKVNFKAWINGSGNDIIQRHSSITSLTNRRLRVKVVKMDRYIVRNTKDKLLEEIVSDKTTLLERHIEKSKKSDFKEVELHAPMVSPEKIADSFRDVEQQSFSSDIHDGKNVSASESKAEQGEREFSGEMYHFNKWTEPTRTLYDTIILKSAPELDKERRTFDTAILEKELMIKTAATNTNELKEKLKNRTNLEGTVGNRHRDYGSSYILPVLLSVNYDNNTVPTVFSDVPVIVAVQMNILYLANFDSELMEYSIDLEMQLSWFDLRLVNNYTKPIRIREKQILDLVWKPNPYFVNSKFSHFHGVSFPNFRMRVFPDGLVKYTMRVTSVCNCFMLFCLYPHDRQTCDLRISSIAYPSTFVQFVWHSDPVSFQSEIALPELHIQRVWTGRCNVEGKLIRSSCIRLVFELERDGSRFIVEKYIPSTLAMMFAWVAPYVPYNYEDVRIITPITVLLTLVQMEKGDKEIRTSYLTSMDVWFAAMKAFTVISLLESLTVLALIKRSRAMEKSEQRAVGELQRENFQQEKYKLTRLYHRLDNLSRFISPIVFVLFFVYYVLFVAQGEERGCVAK